MTVVYCENKQLNFCNRCDEFAHDGDNDYDSRNYYNAKHGV